MEGDGGGVSICLNKCFLNKTKKKWQQRAKQESSGGKRQDLYQQTASEQTASVSKTTYFYHQVARKHWLCGPPVFIDAVLCAGPGYLTTAAHLRLSGRSVWARPSLAWPSELQQA